MIQEKCEKSKKFSYNHLINYKRLNSIIDTAWKKEVPLREIEQIEVAREVVDWFLSLEDSVILTDEQVKDFNERRPKIVIKHHKALNWQRVKYLFTLYIWTRIQENYLEKPYMHYLKKYNSRFKEDADLKASFNMQRERDYLYDLGFIDINYALGINATFIEQYDVFKTPITNENRVIITSGTIGQGDLYRCGYWLEKQKMGSFICQNCKKEFANYTKNAKGRKRVYCKECSDLVLHNKHAEDKKIINCIDCNKEVVIDKTNKRTCRCYSCEQKHRREVAKNSMRALRKNENVSVFSGEIQS